MSAHARHTHNRINELHSKLKGNLGDVTRPNTEVYNMPSNQQEISIGGGWTQKWLFGKNEFDVWVREASDEGMVMPSHCYPDHTLHLISLKGQTSVTFGPEGEKLETLLGENELSELEIPQGEFFNMQSLSPAKIICVFIPPIGEKFVQ